MSAWNVPQQRCYRGVNNKPPLIKTPLPKNLRFLKIIKPPLHFFGAKRRKIWGILSVYRDLQGKIDQIRQAFENNKNPLTTFQISRARNNKNPSQEFLENGRNFSLRGGYY